MLLKLMKNEFIKLFKKPKTWVVIVLFTLLIGGLNFISYKAAEESKLMANPEFQLKHEQSYLQSEESNLKELEDQYKKTSSKEGKEKIQIEIDIAKENISSSKNYIKELENEKNNPPKSWQEKLKIQKESLIKSKESLEKEPNSVYKKNELERLDKQIKLKEYYITNNIEPIDEFGFSIGENFSRISSLLGLGILAAGIAVFMSDIVSGECTPATFKFLLVQPVSRSKIILSKYLTIVISTVGLIVGIQMIITVLGVGIIDGFDSLNSMILINERFEFVKDGLSETISLVSGSGEYVTYGYYLIRAFLFQSLYIVSVTTFVFMISSLLKNGMISAVVSVLISFSGMLLINISSTVTRKYSHLLFLIYGNSSEIITGEFANYSQLVRVTPEMGIKVMLISTIIFYLIAHLRFIRRDILI